jgi:hypothetical protein
MELTQEEEDRLEAMEARMTALEKAFKEAFPEGDWTGHRRYHEVQIEILLERRRLRMVILEKTIPGLIWLTLGVIGLAIWQWFKIQIK